jgi:two-component system sensor histidine kinase YesM
MKAWAFALARGAEGMLDRLDIKNKLILMYFAAFFVPVIIVNVLLSFWLYNTVLDKEIREAGANVEQTEGRFTEIINKVVDLSDRIFVNDRIHQVVRTNYASPLDVYVDYQALDFINDYLHAYPEIASLRLYVINQTLLDNSYFVRTTPSITFAPWYRRAIQLNGRIYWTWKRDDVTGDYHLALIRQIKNRFTREPVGVLVINIDEDRMDRLIHNDRYTTLIALDGDVLYGVHPDEREELRSFINRDVATNQVEQVFKGVSWKGTDSALFVKSFRPLRNLYNFFQIVYVIPMSEMRRTTLTLVGVNASVLLFSLFFSFLFIGLFSRYFWRRVTILRTEIQRIVQQDFEIIPQIGGHDEFSEIHDALFETVGKIKHLINEVYVQRLRSEQTQSRQKDIQFKMLSSQINPHFLYNSLETIRMMAITRKQPDIAHAVKTLAKIFKHNLEVSNKPVSVVNELESVKNYLDMQGIRFGDRVSHEFLLLGNLDKVLILPLLIQPIVENSFIHGLEPQSGRGFIYLTLSIERGALCVRIRDNGVGIEAGRLEEIRRSLASSEYSQGTSIGIVNVNQRIKLHYGEDWGISLESRPGSGSTVTIRLPVVEMS